MKASPDPRRRTGTVVVALGWVLVATVAAAAAPADRGLRVEPPKALQVKVLTDQDGQAAVFPLRDTAWQLVVFGYTHCPDVCPMTLHKTALLLKELDTESDRLRVVFISVDSRRDDARSMKEFVEKFDARITGLTGDAESLQAVANDFGVMTRRYQGKTALAYSMVHSSLLYLLDPAGQVRMLYPPGTAIEALAADLRRLWQDAAAR